MHFTLPIKMVLWLILSCDPWVCLLRCQKTRCTQLSMLSIVNSNKELRKEREEETVTLIKMFLSCYFFNFFASGYSSYIISPPPPILTFHLSLLSPLFCLASAPKQLHPPRAWKGILKRLGLAALDRKQIRSSQLQTELHQGNPYSPAKGSPRSL